MHDSNLVGRKVETSVGFREEMRLRAAATGRRREPEEDTPGTGNRQKETGKGQRAKGKRNEVRRPKAGVRGPESWVRSPETIGAAGPGVPRRLRAAHCTIPEEGAQWKIAPMIFAVRK
jgi:hypothetical protein